MRETGFLISTGLFVVIVCVLIWHFRARTASWMPAEAQLRLHREVRRPPRVPFATAVAIRGQDATMTAESQDLAIGGMLLRPSRPLSVGQPIHVSFTLPTGTTIDIPAVVCRTVGQSFGIRFDVTDKQRTLIGEWVENRRATV